jgi:hypothetical protein
MRFLTAICAVLVVVGWGCTYQRPANPQTYDVKIKVDKVNKKTKIARVVAFREDSIKFTAEAGPVTIIIPTGDFEVQKSPAESSEATQDWIVLKLEDTESAVLSIPANFPDNRHDKTKKREIWYLVICGTGADAYPGEDESPPRIIIRPR